MKCERCGKEISANAGFCPYCGYKVVATDEEKARENEIRAGKRCGKCGERLESGTKFCPSCGTKAEEGGNPVEQKPTQPTKKIVYVRTCKVCGTKVPTSEYYCPHCHTTMGTVGGATGNYGLDKSRLGFWTSFFFGLLALIVGVCMYPSGSTERTTFVDGWVKGFIMSIVIVIAFVVFVCCSVSCLALSA